VLDSGFAPKRAHPGVTAQARLAAVALEINTYGKSAVDDSGLFQSLTAPARSAVDDARFACGRTLAGVARIPQITSLEPRKLWRGPEIAPRGGASGQCVSASSRAYQHIKRQGRDGMSLLEGIIDSPNNPLAVVEDIAASNNWPFERSGEDEVTIVSKGDWTDYQLSFTWMTEIEALHLACAFDMKIPMPRRAEVQRLIAAINEQLWVGHFDIWTHTGMIMYRQALVLPGGMAASTAQCETMLAAALHACERYYPAFQFVVWAGKSAAEAMSAAMFDTEGEA
jgi:hypothetical protein